MTLKEKDRVRKAGGDYQGTGVVLAAFRTLAGKERVVMEFDAIPGLLHIFSPTQLELIDKKEGD